VIQQTTVNFQMSKVNLYLLIYLY